MRCVIVVVMVILFFVGCDDDEEYPQFLVTSMAFAEGETIPRRHTCDGDEISPPLRFKEVPEGTKSFAIILEDPDAPVSPSIQWLIWGIRGTATFLAEDQNANIREGVLMGTNSAGQVSYSGPCPPDTDGSHHYHFNVYALDEMLSLEEGAEKAALVSAMEGHIIGEGKLVGLYNR
ncbi:MAG: YbhB/YbcL family Raf kinase inhibitor-like protein [Deltaproteobacteria bacterium]|nr:YbhB/YbcL family Raf kinase inhibitor-like protein [Deltaproteobacteria bacterium]